MTDQGESPRAETGVQRLGALELPTDRGRRMIVGSISDYTALGKLVRAYQHEHPDTLVRARFASSRRLLGAGTILVEWWPRGEERTR